MIGSARRWIIGFVAVALLAPTAAGAQEVHAPGWLTLAAEREARRVAVTSVLAEPALRSRLQPEAPKRGWIGRHPVLFGALVGFGGGFLIGYVPGRDGTCEDFDAAPCGLLWGGVGAATGAAVGAVVGAVTK